MKRLFAALRLLLIRRERLAERRVRIAPSIHLHRRPDPHDQKERRVMLNRLSVRLGWGLPK